MKKVEDILTPEEEDAIWRDMLGTDDEDEQDYILECWDNWDD